MKNERGEVVTGVLVVMMVCMMIGMFSMHRGHGDRRAGHGNEQKQYSDSDHRHMHDSAADKDSVPAEDGKK